MKRHCTSWIAALHVFWVALFCLALHCTILPGTGRADTLREYEVKAAFIYNFIKFTQWPKEAFPDDATPIRIAIVGTDRFGDAFAPFRAKTIRGRKIKMSYHDAFDTVKESHVTFFSKPDSGERASHLFTSPTGPVLTVGETEGFSRRGGIINFILVKKKIRFEINPNAAERAGLKISSKLLNLATIVRERK